MKITETEFVWIIGNTVKLHLKEKDGTFKNHYHRYEVIINSPIEGMETKQGKIMAMRAIPLDAMERVE